MTQHAVSATPPLLQVKELNRSFGQLHVAKNLQFDLSQGERAALIGPNGAGKTTFINLITGVLSPDAGRITLAGQDITSYSAHKRARAGIGRTFQITSLFRDMTVFENVYLAASQYGRDNLNMFHRAWRREHICQAALEALEMSDLMSDAEKVVSDLSYGRQRLVELAITLALKPKLLLLDEPAAGIPAHETQIVLNALERLPKEMTILMIDHDMDLIFRFAKRIIVLVEGEIFRIGAPDEIAADPEIKRLYFGDQDI